MYFRIEMKRSTMQANDILKLASNALTEQVEAIQLIRQGLDEHFVRAVDLLSNAKTIITTGLGKSSFVAQKMASSFNSVRMRAMYMHPVDALHGDSGFLHTDDVVVAFSKSGETPEMIRFLEQVRSMGIKVIAVTARAQTTVGSLANETVAAPITRELDSQNLIPTASTTSALIVADLLTICTAELNGDMVERLQHSHPHGAIGSALLRTVNEVMHSGTNMPIIGLDQTVSAALVELSSKSLGIVCICNTDGSLAGIITDGDVRRLATQGIELGSQAAADIMTKEPLTIPAESTVHEALLVMENRERQISVLPVVRHGKVVGIVRVHDLVRVTL